MIPYSDLLFPFVDQLIAWILKNVHNLYQCFTSTLISLSGRNCKTRFYLAYIHTLVGDVVSWLNTRSLISETLMCQIKSRLDFGRSKIGSRWWTRGGSSGFLGRRYIADARPWRSSKNHLQKLRWRFRLKKMLFLMKNRKP